MDQLLHLLYYCDNIEYLLLFYHFNCSFLSYKIITPVKVKNGANSIFNIQGVGNNLFVSKEYK